MFSRCFPGTIISYPETGISESRLNSLGICVFPPLILTLFFACSGDVCFMGTGSPVGGHVNFEVEDVCGKKLFGKMTYVLLCIKSVCNKTHVV